MHNNTRINFAINISKEVMKNPEAAINFINCVAFEASISDLIRIHTNFLNTNRLKNKSNENN